MELHEYPRPANDTGIGVHWTVGFASAIGIGKIRDIWIPELKALGVKWIKIFNHDGAIDVAELLLAEGIMPIVRIFRPSPNPSTLDVREVVHLDSFIRAGVRYFEFNSEPDRDSEWKGGRVPANGFELVVDNTIANLETILERGGMPGIPAVANGSRWDLVGRIVAKGRKDLLNGPVWQAIHNYSRNRPLDYPYDSGNQEGAPFSQRFYQAVQNSEWSEDPWRGRELADVNRLRLDRCNPGATIMDDNACWLAYEYFDVRNQKHLGRSIPILATECGYLVGEDIDPRYPATTPELHMAQTLEACRIMMGSSERFQSAPDYYFCSAFWLLGNGVLGSSSNWWEHHAWYSDKWPAGLLPIVHALKAEPKKVRQWQQLGADSTEIGAQSLLRGTVSHAGEHRTLILEQNGQEVARTTLDANSRYVMADLTAGSYLLRVEGTTVEQPVSLPPEQKVVQVNLDLAQSSADSGGSIIEGTVRGGAGAVVVLLRTSDGEDWVTMVKDDGTFRFVELGAGSYTLRVQGDGNTDLATDPPPPAPDVEISLDGQNRQKVELSVPGWGYTVRRHESDGRHGAIQCAVPGHAGLQVQAILDDWRSEPVTTGSAPHLGEGACEIAHLEPGYYTLSIESADTPGAPAAHTHPIQLQAFVQVDRKSIPFVEFVYTEPSTARAPMAIASTIRGRIIGGCEPGRRLYVWLIDQQANRREQRIGDDCTFAFERLEPGLYSVEVAGYADEARRADIALDGRNTVHVELLVPETETSVPGAPEASGAESLIVGRVPDGTGRRARLVDSVGNEQQQIVEPDHTFRFEGLSAGVYTLTVEGGYAQSDLTLDGANGIEVLFQPLELHWEYQTSPAGSMPGYSVIRVEVEGMRGLPIYIWKEDWEGMMRRTGSKPEYGECSAEFSPLGPGIYMVEPEGLDIYADIELTGLEVVWVDFRRRAVPINPHEVRPFAQGSRALNGHAEMPFDAPRDRYATFAGEADEYDFYTESSAPRNAEEATEWDAAPESESFGSLRFDSITDDENRDWIDSDAEQATPHEPWTGAPETWGQAEADRESTERDYRKENGTGAAPLEQGREVPASTTLPRESCYLYLVEEVYDLDDQIALLRYAAQTQPGIGQAIDEALTADRVLIVAPGLATVEAESAAQPEPTPPAGPITDEPAAEIWGAENILPVEDLTQAPLEGTDHQHAAEKSTQEADSPEESPPDETLQDEKSQDEVVQKADQALENFDWELDDDADLNATWPGWPAWNETKSPTGEHTAPDTGDDTRDMFGSSDSVEPVDRAAESFPAWGFQNTDPPATDSWDEDAGIEPAREFDPESDRELSRESDDRADLGETSSPAEFDIEQESRLESEPEDESEPTAEPESGAVGEQATQAIDDLYAAWIAAAARSKADSTHASGDSEVGGDSETGGDSEFQETTPPDSAVESTGPESERDDDMTRADTFSYETFTGPSSEEITEAETAPLESPGPSAAASAGDTQTTPPAVQEEGPEALDDTRNDALDTVTARRRALLAEVEALEARLRTAGISFRRITGKLAPQLEREQLAREQRRRE